ncbi:hypothetical protein KC332_g9276 [Hortaea werneckii]|uniref:Cation/H+ exchanger transmembrane domain-containing protein n=2 Tax=Hortaea werneckii TaxID=91943 RepID=A0A3M7IY29_HORWE|nr:hypothetical protein KC358_g8966 [Hortaea werneckii]OTA36863.1 hypothetical protein BTJ68_03725 [Hortaea werneckii EXF-2000]KAI6826776.1 hypothetical protein KC350_g8450 [Hortaea werneckii]KAI6932807.1 hypothetical protein KC341_g8754 [Hortaea werneckii]KAI6938007.1 hypothetical protein KC348_g5580 [Hortaea werneckii]
MATITVTATNVVTTTLASASATSTLKAPSQGGILDGENPTKYDSKNPIILFIIQAGIILIFCRLLHWPLSKVRQPRVIAEVIGGILLGPSIMGRIPGFTSAIFPPIAMDNLALVANIGLVLFLFLVGLEVDLRYFASNWKVALSVGLAGMALPFGLGCAISWGLYNEFRTEANTAPIGFGIYSLFIGIAMSITAFPVLCRILTELKLLSTPVGIIVLSAGAGNDVVGWILLALCVALVNAGSGLTALWVLLTCVGYVLVLFFIVRPLFIKLLRRTHSLQDGPSQSMIALTLLIALTSAFFTGVIGVHPIFGAFLAGLICPHEGGFAIKVTEKVEDLVSTLFLPLYFALSGLQTNLGLLDNGITWAYVIGVISVAFFAKFGGGALAARLNGLVWRESCTIGVLMSCKGLVELIVLNIGRNADILSERTFTIFVVMALVTTFSTTPLTALLYPPWYQRKLESWKRGEIDWQTGLPLLDGTSDGDGVSVQKLESTKMQSLLIYLRLDSMPTSLALVSLFGSRADSCSTPKKHPALEKESPSAETAPGTLSESKRPIQVHGVRLVELTERGSSVMKVTEVDEYSFFDPVLNAFRILGQVYNLAVSGEVAVIPESTYAETLVNKAVEESSNLLLLPWSETGSISESQTISSDSVQNKLASDAYVDFISQALELAQCNIAVFINQGFSGTLKQRPSALKRSMSALSLRTHREHYAAAKTDRSHHIFLPFLGGPDGRVALRLVLQLAENAEVTATIVHFKHAGNGAHEADQAEHESFEPKTDNTSPSQTHTASPEDDDSAFFATMQRSLADALQSKVIFRETSAERSTEAIISTAEQEVEANPKNAGDIVVVGRGKGNGGTCLGAIADAIVSSNVKASLLVVQARVSD